MDVVGHAERARGATRFGLFLRPDLRIARVLGRAAVGDANDAHLVAAIGVERDRAAHAEHLVVRVRRDDEDTGHPSSAPTGRGSGASTSSSNSAPPPPQATTGPSERCSTTVPGMPDSAPSTCLALQTTTFESPKKVNAPG